MKGSNNNYSKTFCLNKHWCSRLKFKKQLIMQEDKEEEEEADQEKENEEEKTTS